jgi:hypothetical protein
MMVKSIIVLVNNQYDTSMIHGEGSRGRLKKLDQV